MPYKISAKQFDLFKKECLKWRDAFGLRSYELGFQKVNDTGARAEMMASPQDQMACMMLYMKWNDKPTTYEIKKSAMHEICELLLWDIREMLRKRFSEDVVNTEIHKIIRTLENVFFENETKK